MYVYKQYESFELCYVPMADGTFVLILLSPGCWLVHLTGNDDSKDGSFKNSLFGIFFSLFFGKQGLC